MKLVLGSKNRAKLRAIEMAGKAAWEGVNIEVIGIYVESGVNDQPMSESETIEGAINRAKNALLEVPDADIALGLEGGARETDHGMFMFGWVGAVDRAGQIGLGCTVQTLIPEHIANKLRSGTELGDVMRDLTNNLHGSHEKGAFGVLTNNLVGRDTTFRDAVFCALAPWYNNQVYVG